MAKQWQADTRGATPFGMEITQGDFSRFQASQDESEMFSRAYEAMRAEDWAALREEEPDPQEGFFWTRNTRLVDAMSRINDSSPGHSGFSVAFTARHLQTIAREGWDAYCGLRLSPPS